MDTAVAGVFSGSSAKAAQKLARGKGWRADRGPSFLVGGTKGPLAADALDVATALGRRGTPVSRGEKHADRPQCGAVALVLTLRPLNRKSTRPGMVIQGPVAWCWPAGKALSSSAAPNAPAFLLPHVQRPDGIAQADDLAAVLQAAGTSAEEASFPGTGLAGHAEINRRLGDPSYAETPVIDAWLAKVFA